MNTKTQKRENPKTAKTAKTPKTRKRENGENPKTAKTRKPENGESRKAVFASSNMLQSIKLAIKDARRWEQRETRKRENGQKPVFWFSGFLVFSFSGFLVSLAASFWPGRVFYVLRQNAPMKLWGEYPLKGGSTKIPSAKVCSMMIWLRERLELCHKCLITKFCEYFGY